MMKNFSFGMLVLMMALASVLTAKANPVTVGPFTFGSNDPYLGEPTIYPTGSNGGVLLSYGPFPNSGSETIAFTFAIASGWAIDGMQFGIQIEPSYPGEYSGDYEPWGVEFAQKITLCSATDVCSSELQSVIYGYAPLPGYSFHAEAGPGTGVYQSFLYVDNAQLTQEGPDQLIIFFSPASPVPEPSSWWLAGAGLLAFGLFRLRKSTL
jgi:hypothetical protein